MKKPQERFLSWAMTKGIALSLPSTQRLVLLTLAWASDNDGVAFFRLADLAIFTGLSIRAGHETVHALEAAGLICISRRKSGLVFELVIYEMGVVEEEQ